jgi:hypothetical protein
MAQYHYLNSFILPAQTDALNIVAIPRNTSILAS